VRDICPNPVQGGHFTVFMHTDRFLAELVKEVRPLAMRRWRTGASQFSTVRLLAPSDAVVWQRDHLEALEGLAASL
jgi:hypothetical protein